MLKKLIILSLISISAQAKDYSWKVKKVVDGDTMEVITDFLPPELKLSIRAKNIDTPEKRGKCQKEKDLAAKASKFTTNLVNNSKRVVFSEPKWDKYGGRILAQIIIDGKPLENLLIKEGLAREYHGEKKSNWCN